MILDYFENARAAKPGKGLCRRSLASYLRLIERVTHNILDLRWKRLEVPPRRADPNDTLDLWRFAHGSHYASSGIFRQRPWAAARIFRNFEVMFFLARNSGPAIILSRS